MPRSATTGAMGRLAVACLAGLLLALASFVVQRERDEVQDWDCPPAPASCARPVLVAGFPLPFVSDYHGISVVGRVSLVGAFLGEDDFHARPFLLNAVVYAVAVASVAALFRRR